MMNTLLWVLQILTALMFGTSGVMKAFMFEKVSVGVPSFGALPRKAWTVLGILEISCVIGLIAPGLLHWYPGITVVAAAVLMIESLLFIWVHSKYGELTPIVLSGVLSFVMAFIVYGRLFLRPIF